MKYHLDAGHDPVGLGDSPFMTWEHFPRLDELQKLNVEILNKVLLNEDFRTNWLVPAHYALNRVLHSPDLKTTDMPYICFSVTDPAFLKSQKPEPVYFAIWVEL